MIDGGLESWGREAERLGLRRYLIAAAYTRDMSFARLRRLVAGSAEHLAPSLMHAWFGSQEGREVAMVRFLDRAGDEAFVFDAVIARFTPPLFVGVSMRSQVRSPFSVSAPVTGRWEFDDNFLISSAEPGVLRHILAEADTDGARRLGAALQAAIRTGRSVNIHDDCAAFIGNLEETPDMMDRAIELSAALEERLREIPDDARGSWPEGTWTQFSEAEGLKFDLHARVLSCVLEGGTVEIAAEYRGAQACTVVTLEFAQVLPTEITATSTAWPGFLHAFLGQDIRVNHAGFDSAYIIRASNPALGRPQLQRAGLGDAMTEIAAWADEARMTARGLEFRVRGFLAEVESLERALNLCRRVARALAGGQYTGTPYR